MSRAGRTTKKLAKKGSPVTSRILSTNGSYECNEEIVGVDSGQTGALVSIDARTGDVIDVLDTPIVFAPNSKAKLVDGMAVSRWLQERKPKLIVVEMVSARPAKRFKGKGGDMVAGQGIASTFQFGMSYGAIVALSLACPCPMELVTSAKWKMWLSLTGEKERTRQWALKRHAASGHFFKLKKHGGRGDAAAIAEYGRKFILHSD